MGNTKHIGKNIRNIRVLLGMKQKTFAKELGIAQQNVSKMENKKEMTPEKLEAAAKVLGLTVEAIENFNEKVQLNNNIALEQNSGQIIHPVKDVIDYFKEELLKRDKKIEELQAEIQAYQNNKKKSPPHNKTAITKELRSVEEQNRRVAGE